MASNKDVPKRFLDAFSESLTRWVDEACDGNQSEAGKHLGLSQSHISALMGGKKRPGLAMLIALREVTGKPIDEWLGFPAPGQPSAVIIRRLASAVQRELEAIEREEAAKSTE